MADYVDYPLLHITIKSVGIFSRNFHSVLHASLALHVPHLVSFFPFEIRVRKCHKKPAHLFVNNLRKFRKFTNSSISDLGDIKEVSYS